MTMSHVEQKISQKIFEELSVLPLTEQKKVLAFVRELRSQSARKSQLNQPKTFGEVAHRYSGCVDGPEDLSSNQKHMEGFGKR